MSEGVGDRLLQVSRIEGLNRLSQKHGLCHPEPECAKTLKTVILNEVKNLTNRMAMRSFAGAQDDKVASFWGFGTACKGLRYVIFLVRLLI